MEDVWKVRMNICTALWSFVNFCCLSQSEVNTDNRKVSTFFAFQHVRCRCCYRSYLDRFLKLKFCFFNMVHWITIHFLIHYLLFKNFAVCCSFSITRALNTAETAWMKFVFCCLFTALYSRWKSELTGIYYINTNEIPNHFTLIVFK